MILTHLADREAGVSRSSPSVSLISWSGKSVWRVADGGADKSYWSAGDRDDPDYASQQTLYEDLGVELLDHSFEGFNTCIFACEYTSSATDMNRGRS